HRRMPYNEKVLLRALGILAVLPLSAQAPPPLQQPWEGVPAEFRKLPVGRLEIPPDLATWKQQREKVKAIVLAALGGLPPRPKPVRARTVSVTNREGYRIEKLVFHNGVDNEVPGYLAIPDRPGRRPAVLAMHGHGSNKENIFGIEPSSQDVAELLARRGYVVMGIDNYFNGERKGERPAGEMEGMGKRADQGMSLFKLRLWLGRTLLGVEVPDA